MPIHIPPQETRRWDGIYQGDYYGQLWKTFNIDLDRFEGKVCLSRGLTVRADTSDTNTDTLGTVTTFLRANSDCVDKFWALSSGGALYRTNTPGGGSASPSDSWSVDSLTNSPTDALDMATFENDSTGDTGKQQLFVTRATDISSLNDTGNRAWNSSWWVTEKGQTALKATGVHPICYFPFTKIMLIGDGNLVHTISRTSVTASETVTASRLVLPTEFQVRHIFATSNRVWILCKSVLGELLGNGNGNGKIIEWDGFSQTYNEIYDCLGSTPMSGVAYLDTPIILTQKGFFLEYNGRSFVPMMRNGQKIGFPIKHDDVALFSLGTPRAMTVGTDGLVYINAPRPNQSIYNQGSGIWCLDPQTGRFYSKYSLGQWGGSDFGQTFHTQGGIFTLESGISSGSFLIGGLVAKNILNDYRAKIYTLTSPSSTTALRGYFITQFIHSSEIKDFWDSLWLRFRRFTTSTNRIIVKAKGTRSLAVNGSSGMRLLQADITWTSTTTFTVTLGAANDALAVGDEVEVTGGDNAGTLSHITAISGAHAALQTITIDETMPVSSTSVSTALFDRWKKIGVISDASIYEANIPIGINSSFIQFKVELRGPTEELVIDDLIVNNKPNVYIQK